jgi:hypothetical protein
VTYTSSPGAPPNGNHLTAKARISVSGVTSDPGGAVAEPASR